MRRRTLLAGVGAAALAGCAGLSSLGAEPSNRTYQLTTDDIGDAAALARSRTWTPDDDDPQRIHDAWERATGGGSVETVGYTPLPEEYTVRDGTYSLLRSTVVGVERVERPVLRASRVGRVEDTDVNATAAASLPEVDQHAIPAAYFAARAREREGGAPWELIERGGYVYRTGVNESELVPESEHEYVAYEGTVLRIRVATERFHDPVYETDARPVADSRAEFVDVIEGAELDAVLDSDALGEEPRRILDRAGSNAGYEEEVPLSEAYTRLLKQLHLRRLLYVSGTDAVNGRLLKLDDRYHRYGLYIHSPQN